MAKQNTDKQESPSSSSSALKAPKGFALVNWKFGSKIDAGKYGVIDLDTLTTTRAAQLVTRGFPYLKKV